MKAKKPKSPSISISAFQAENWRIGRTKHRHLPYLECEVAGTPTHTSPIVAVITASGSVYSLGQEAPHGQD